MDVYDATDAQAQEIVDMLNGATSGTYTVTLRTGDVEATYSASAADEVMWMVRQGEQRVEGVPSSISVNEAADLHMRDGKNRIVNPDMAVVSTFSGRQPGKSTAWTAIARAQVEELTKILKQTQGERDDAYARIAALQESLKKANGHMEYLEKANYELAQRAGAQRRELARRADALKRRADEAQRERDASKYERDRWEETAAMYAKGQEWYQEQLDRCGRAVGGDVYMCDDGTKVTEPLRAKVAEMVEKICESRATWSDRSRELQLAVDERDRTIINYENSVKWLQEQLERCASALTRSRYPVKEVQRKEVAGVAYCQMRNG